MRKIIGTPYWRSKQLLVCHRREQQPKGELSGTPTWFEPPEAAGPTFE
jgi:hypothetical protein